MKFERSKEWWMDRALVKATPPSAPACSRSTRSRTSAASAQIAAVEETRIAFGKFVNLMRRRRGFSMEQLAQAADLDASELLVIEDDVHHVPEPRTVFKLAETFEVSQRRLMQLAGLAAANDAGFRQEAVRFAARSEVRAEIDPGGELGSGGVCYRPE